MASQTTLDIERLAAAISVDSPSGSYLRDTDYDRLQKAKDARSQAIAVERKLRDLEMYSDEDLEQIPEQDRQIEAPNWRVVLDQCSEILAKHSKDLWVASWLIEANTRLEGFAGARDGFRLVTQIVEKYWDQIYPPRDDNEGYLNTVSQLTSLNGEEGAGILVAPLESLSLVPDQDEFSFAAYRQAIEGTEGKVREGEFFAACRQVDPDQLRALGEDIDQTIVAFSEMNAALGQRCGTHDGMPVAPPSSQILRTLEECKRTFQLLTRDVLSEGDAENTVERAAVGGEVITGGVVDPSKAQVTNREDAFRMLLRASEFFRKTEPHSPVSYMLQQAVRFGRMDLPELLQELIDNEDVLKRFAERTGIEINKEIPND